MKSLTILLNESITDLYSLKKIRSFLETKWDNTNPLSQCIRTTYFLQKILGGKIAGGWVSSNPLASDKGGFKDQNGKWNFHYWLVLDNQIVDLTADQFGESPIIITSIKDHRYHSTATSQDIKQDFRFTPEIVDNWIGEFNRG